MKRIVSMLCITALGIITVIFVGYWNFFRTVDNQISTLRSNAQNNTTIVTDEMLQSLPSPVQRYLRYSGVVGKPIPRFVSLKQTGRIRQSPDAQWMNFQATQYYSVSTPSFVWIAMLPSYTMPFVVGVDRYNQSHGYMLIRMLSLFPLVDAKGTELDQGAMMRYLNEMMWFPASYLGNNVTWKPIDDRSCEITLTDNGKSVSAVLSFDEEGKLINFVAKRYMTEGTSYRFETWSTPIREYATFEGLKLPTKGTGVWNLPEGDFQYIDVRIDDIRYQ